MAAEDDFRERCVFRHWGALNLTWRSRCISISLSTDVKTELKGPESIIGHNSACCMMLSRLNTVLRGEDVKICLTHQKGTHHRNMLGT